MPLLEVLYYLPEYCIEVSKHCFYDASFDKKYGTDTSRFMPTNESGVSKSEMDNAALYWPVNSSNFSRMLKKLPTRDINGKEFVDLGCGKGRAILLATDFPFGLITGVEFSTELCALAKNNISLFRKKNLTTIPINIIHQNATAYFFDKNSCAIFMFDPFGPEVVASVIENLKRSLQENPRPLYVLYYLPTHGSLFEKAGFTIFSEQKRNFRLDYPWKIYVLTQNVE